MPDGVSYDDPACGAQQTVNVPPPPPPVQVTKNETPVPQSPADPGPQSKMPDGPYADVDAGPEGGPLDFLRADRQDSPYIRDFRDEVRQQEAEYQAQVDARDIGAYLKWRDNYKKLHPNDDPVGIFGDYAPRYDEHSESPGELIGGSIGRGFELTHQGGPVTPLTVAGNISQFLIPEGEIGVLFQGKSPPVLPTFIVDAKVHPNLAENIWHAQQSGRPTILTYNGPGSPLTRANRAAATDGIPSIPGTTRDEYPFASTQEGGAGSWVAHVGPPEHPYAQGGALGNFYRTQNLKAGDQFRVEVRNFSPPP